MDVGVERVEVAGMRCREEGCGEVAEELVRVQVGVEEEGRCLSKTSKKGSGQ